MNGNQYGATGVLPPTDEMPGRYSFRISAKKDPSQCSYLYSEALNQVFIDIDKVLMVTFTVDARLPGACVRAVLVHTSPDFKSTPVIRCKLHQLSDDPRGLCHTIDNDCMCSSHNLAGHVLRVDSVGRWYCFDATSGRHSVVVPLGGPNLHQNNLYEPQQPPPPPERVPVSFDVPYVFACKTSCPTGMQRRPIQIVFTLETANGVVVGRRTLKVKISSCPKRDKERMERDAKVGPGKRLMKNNNDPPPSAKKVKLELVVVDNDNNHRNQIQNRFEEIKTSVDQLLGFCNSKIRWIDQCSFE